MLLFPMNLTKTDLCDPKLYIPTNVFFDVGCLQDEFASYDPSPINVLSNKPDTVPKWSPNQLYILSNPISRVQSCMSLPQQNSF